MQRSATSPATIRFQVVDQERNSSDVELRYRSNDPGSMFASITLDPASNPLTDVPSDSAMDYEVLWDFAADLGDESFQSGIELELTIVGGVSPPILVGVAVGNDPPEILLAEPSPAGAVEYSANADVRFALKDSAADDLRIRVEFNADAAGEFPAGSWQLARPAGTPLTEPTPTYAFTGLLSDTNSIEEIFVWDSEFDLGGLEQDVRMRFTPEDDFEAGASLATDTFRVDNNAAPLAVLDEANLVLNPDQRRGIPIPFRVFDDESDPVRVLVQWTRQGEPFPALPATVPELIALLDDPAKAEEARELQVATQAPPTFRGRVGALAGLAANEVRLPELASDAAGLLGLGIAGRTLEIVRASNIPESLSWATNPLDGPVAALPIGDGRTALVLDRSASSWRVREVELATGNVIQNFASGNGVPKAMTMDPLRTQLFVGSDSAIYRFSYPGGQPEGSILNTSFDGPRGLAALGSDAIVATGDNVLVRIDFATGTVVTLLDGLSEPWGVVADPLDSKSLYLSERSANRVVSIDLDSLVPRPLIAEVDPLEQGALGAVPFPSPRAIALERAGARLLVLTEEQGGAISLRGLDLRSPLDDFVFEITDQLGEAEAGLASGADGLRLAALPNSSTLTAGGGLVQSRKILAVSGGSSPQPYDPTTQVATVTNAFDPLPTPQEKWRIHAPRQFSSSSPTGMAQVFVWDSSEVIEGGRIRLEITPLDSDIGIKGASISLKTLRSGLDVEPFVFDDPALDFPESVCVADLDGDGDLDIASGSLASFVSNIIIYFQTSPGAFDPVPTVLSDPAIRAASSLVAADLDGDGDMDLVSANRVSDNLTIFFQNTPGQFTIDPNGPLSDPAINGPWSVIAADLDGDGDMDLASANTFSSNLTIFFQTGPGLFVSPPVVLTANNLSQTRSIAAADLDEDGDIDLVASGSRLTIFFQTESGLFASSPTVPFDSAIGSRRSVATADLDGDGDTDIVSTGFGNLAIFFQTAPGQFTIDLAGVLRDPNLSDPGSVAAADLDGDGDIDIVTANNEDKSLTAFLQASPGQFFQTPIVLSDPDGFFPTSVAVADVDGDGSVDLVSSNSDVRTRNHTLSLYSQSTPGELDETPTVLIPYSSQFLTSVDTADLDGDGDCDIVCANAGGIGGGTMSIFFQSAPGLFDLDPGGPVSLFSAAEISFATTGDIDGDGDIDIVAATGKNNVLRIFRQTAPGRFSRINGRVSHPALDNPRFIALGDLDGDGDADIVCANRFGDSLIIFFQSPAGRFNQSPAILTHPAIDTPSSVAVADLDGDGDLDVVSANEDTDSLLIFFQIAPGQFAPDPNGSLASNFGPRSVATADLDGDGDIDLVSANEFTNGGNLTIHFQTAPGVFTPDPRGSLVNFPTMARPTSVIAADIDADGDIDLISVNDGSNNFTVFLQTTPGRFAFDSSGTTSSPSVDKPVSIAIADLDGDGELDLLSGNQQSENLTIFFAGR